MEDFFDSLSKADNRLLILDYDGTLAPFKVNRDKALPYPGVIERLAMLIDTRDTRVFIVSGRTINDLKHLLSLKKYPEMWGSHGFEHLDSNGNYSTREITQVQRDGLTLARDYIEKNDFEKYLEIKPASIAIHFRGVKHNIALDIEDRIIHNWTGLTKEYSLSWSHFDGGLELGTETFNKGDVVRSIMKDYRSNAIASYLGDDLTDEDAFMALPEDSLGVLVRRETRPTAARLKITPPEELLVFLDRWLKIEIA